MGERDRFFEVFFLRSEPVLELVARSFGERLDLFSKRAQPLQTSAQRRKRFPGRSRVEGREGVVDVLPESVDCDVNRSLVGKGLESIEPGLDAVEEVSLVRGDRHRRVLESPQGVSGAGKRTELSHSLAFVIRASLEAHLVVRASQDGVIDTCVQAHEMNVLLLGLLSVGTAGAHASPRVELEGLPWS